MRKLHPGVAAGLLAVAMAAVFALAWGYAQRWLSGWTVFALALVGVVTLFYAGRWLETREPENDPLRRWREFRVAKVLTLASHAQRGCTLDLELYHDENFTGRSTTLRFHGVAALRVAQLDDHAILFDHLVAEDRGAAARGKRYVVRDRWNEGLSFTCDSFEAVNLLQGVPS